MSDEQFLFDDFFVSQDASDPGERVEVELRGRMVPIYLKRGLSFADREAAKSQAVKIRIKPNGQPEILSIDEGIFAVELLVRSIKSWPFIYRNGNHVEVTRENIKAMLSDSADALARMVLERMRAKAEKMAPFTTPSEQSYADPS